MIGCLPAVFLIGLFSQGPDTLWTRCYGGEAHDYGRAVRRCADGGYIVAGSTASFGAGAWDVYLVRTDSVGDTLWTRTYGGPDEDGASDIQVTPDRGFIFAGYTKSYGSGGKDVYLVRTDSLGNPLWIKVFGGANDDEALSVRETPDLGFAVCGTTYSFGAGDADIYLIRTDSLGDSLWAMTYGGPAADLGAGVAVIEPDSDLMICGTTYSFGSGIGDVYLIRTDPKGDTVWTRTYGDVNDERGYRLLATADTGFIAAGTSYFSLLGYEMFAFKTDRDGNVRWNFYNGSLGDDYAYALAEIPGRGYVVGGNFSYEMFLIRTDTAGNNQQQWIFGGAGTDCAYDIEANPDGSYAVVGNTSSFGHGLTDIWLIKMNKDTLAVCESARKPAAAFNLEIFPNPCRDRAVFRIQGRGHSATRFGGADGLGLDIYDIAGRSVKCFSLPSSLIPNPSAVIWDGSDQDGRAVPPGVYFAVLRTGGRVASAKVVLQ